MRSARSTSRAVELAATPAAALDVRSAMRDGDAHRVPGSTRDDARRRCARRRRRARRGRGDPPRSSASSAPTPSSTSRRVGAGDEAQLLAAVGGGEAAVAARRQPELLVVGAPAATSGTPMVIVVRRCSAMTALPQPATQRLRRSPMPSIGCEHVARLQEARRLPGGADARRRAGEDHVAGQQREDRRQLGDQRGTEKTMSRVRLFCITSPFDRAAEREVVGFGELVGRHEPRARSGRTRKGLAERELRRRPATARCARRRPARPSARRRGASRVRSATRRAARPMTTTSSTSQSTDRRRQHDVGVGTDEAGRELRERRRAVRQRQSALGGVVLVVEADAEDLRRTRRRGAQVRVDDRRRVRRRRLGGPATELVPAREDRLRVRSEAAARRRLDVDAAARRHEVSRPFTFAMRIVPPASRRTARRIGVPYRDMRELSIID